MPEGKGTIAPFCRKCYIGGLAFLFYLFGMSQWRTCQTPLVIQEEPIGNAEQPRFKTRKLTKPGQPLPCADKCFLSQIVCSHLIAARQPVQETSDRCLMRLYQLAESPLTAKRHHLRDKCDFR